MSAPAAGTAPTTRALARPEHLGSLALGYVAASLVLAVAAPMWALLLAPLLLGVPHVVSDVRYLVLRLPGGMDRGARWTLALPLVGLLLLRVVVVCGGPSAPRLELALGVAAVGGLLARSPGRPRARAGAAAALLIFAGTALARPEQIALLLGHLHNLIALLFFLWWSRPWIERPGRVAILAAFGLGVAAILAGAFDAIALAPDLIASPAEGLSFAGLVDTLAPGLDARWGQRWVLAFAFAQLVHYASWMHLVPLAARDQVPRGLAGLRVDFGARGTWWLGAACLALPAVGTVAPAAARATYLSLVLFHGWLELAVAAFLLGRRARA